MKQSEKAIIYFHAPSYSASGFQYRRSAVHNLGPHLRTCPPTAPSRRAQNPSCRTAATETVLAPYISSSEETSNGSIGPIRRWKSSGKKSMQLQSDKYTNKQGQCQIYLNIAERGYIRRSQIYENLHRILNADRTKTERERHPSHAGPTLRQRSPAERPIHRARPAPAGVGDAAVLPNPNSCTPPGLRRTDPPRRRPDARNA